jgi:TolB-like protein
MKKVIISFIIFIVGALSLFIYSSNNEGRATRLSGEEMTSEKKVSTSPAKGPTGSAEVPLITGPEIKEPATSRDETEKPIEDAIHKKEPAIKAEARLEAALPVQEIKEKGEQPATFTAEVSPGEMNRKDEARPLEKETDRFVEKKELIIKEEPVGTAEKITVAAPVEEIIITVDKPVLIKEVEKAAIPREEIKQPIIKTALAREESRVVEEKAETMPAGGLIIMPIETPATVLSKLSSAGSKDIMPERAKEQPSVKMEPAVAVVSTEKATVKGEIISLAEKTKGDMEKPGPFTGEMLIEGNNKRIAIFPFENLSDNRDAFKHVLPLLIDKLEKRGFEVVDEDDLNNFLCGERVRSTGYISRELSGKIRKRFNVSTILAGAIISFSDEDIPEFGILARMVETSGGTIIWADYSAATGEDFIAVLELGRLKTVFSLIPKVIDILFASYKDGDINRETKHLHRIAVMPFKNNTGFNNAGIIATYMFIVEIFKSRLFIPVEYGDIRDIIIKQGIRLKGDIGYENISELSNELKARGILVGVVDNYSNGADGSMSPNAGITARLVDGSNKKIMWYNSSQLSGEDNIIALDWGRIRSVHSVAYKAVSGLVKEMSRKKWRD